MFNYSSVHHVQANVEAHVDGLEELKAAQSAIDNAQAALS